MDTMINDLLIKFYKDIRTSDDKELIIQLYVEKMLAVIHGVYQ